jgi:hypothetical protein
MERKRVEVGMCTFEEFPPEGRIDDVGKNGSARVFCVKVRPLIVLIEAVSEMLEGIREEDRVCGERRKSKDQVFLAPGPQEEPFWRSCSIRFCGRGSEDKSGGNRSAGIGLKLVSGSCINSRISLIVKAACTGPRRPTIRMFLMRLSASRSNAQLVMSVLRSRSISVSRIRATSRATFPWPMMIASSPAVRSRFRSRYSGSPSYQPTKALAEYMFLMSSSPSSPSVRSFEAPYANMIAS